MRLINRSQRIQGPMFMDCISPVDIHIVADPCPPRWVVRCEHGHWFGYGSGIWTDKRDELCAYTSLFGLAHTIATKHPPIETR